MAPLIDQPTTRHAAIVLGSRLDNRQRSGNTKQFATGATVHVVDIDKEELAKYRNDGYRVSHLISQSCRSCCASSISDR